MWKQLAAFVSLVFLFGLVETIRTRQITGCDLVFWLATVQFAFLLFTFVVGDLGLYRITDALNNPVRAEAVLRRYKAHVVWDVLAALTHVFVLAAAGWLSTRDAATYLNLLNLLMVVNVLWLASKMWQLIQIKDVLVPGGRDGELRGRITNAQYAILVWLCLNVVYAGGMCYVVVGMNVQAGAWLEEALWLSASRTVLDIALTRRFLADVLAREFCPARARPEHA